MNFTKLTHCYLTAALLLALLVALATVWSLISASTDLTEARSTAEWLQPERISDTYPEAISSAYWQFDYDEIEQILAQIKQSKEGELILNQGSLKILKDAVSKFPNEIGEKSLGRIKLLTSKSVSVSGEAGLQLGDLLVNFYAYTKATEKSGKSYESMGTTAEGLDNQERRFQDLLIKQKHFLGPAISEKLFGRKNALNQYLYARRRVNEDASLSLQQKQQLLSQLQERFKKNAN